MKKKEFSVWIDKNGNAMWTVNIAALEIEEVVTTFTCPCCKESFDFRSYYNNDTDELYFVLYKNGKVTKHETKEGEE